MTHVTSLIFSRYSPFIILGNVNLGKIANINTFMSCVQNKSVGMINVNLGILSLANLMASANFSKGNFVFTSILLMMMKRIIRI